MSRVAWAGSSLALAGMGPAGRAPRRLLRAIQRRSTLLLRACREGRRSTALVNGRTFYLDDLVWIAYGSRDILDLTLRSGFTVRRMCAATVAAHACSGAHDCCCGSVPAHRSGGHGSRHRKCSPITG